ncbi:MAG: universal stress protein [Hymenobacteraceae bacterium]|nr:universal stress protein [Hymenobacteraceae bacterium]
MKNIVVTIDFTKNSTQLIEKAAALAQQLQAKLWLLHIAAPDPDFVGYEPGPQSVRNIRADELRTEHVQLQELTDQLIKDGMDAEGLLIQGPTSETITDAAVKLHADLIVIGYYNHSFFYNMWFGNNTTEVIQRSSVPVLVVPLFEAD